MSPSEAQLRAALHDGEGDSPDAGLLIARARGLRRDRRRRLNAVAGGIAAVTVGTTLLVALTHTGGESSGSSSSSGTASNADAAGKAYSARSRANGAAGAPTAASTESATSTASAASSSRAAAAGQPAAGASKSAASAKPCPARPDQLMLPGGGGSGQFGSSAALFAGTVSAMKVCAYPLRSGAKTSAAVLDGAAARELARTLTAAPATRSSNTCPTNTDVMGGTIEILGVDPRGTALKPVVITLGCGTSQATNGTAVRYLDSVPDTLRKLLVVSSPVRMQGSPVRS